MGTELSAAQQTRAVELMLGTLQARVPEVGEAARKLFVDEAGRWDVAHLWDSDRAMVILTKAVPARWGPPEPHLHVLTDGTKESLDWFGDQRGEISNVLGPSVMCRVSRARRELVAPLRSLGLGVSKLALGGAVRTMLARADEMTLIDPAALGLELQTVSTLEQIRAASELRKAYFTRHPEHGWASATLSAEDQAEIDRRVERQFQRRLDEGLGNEFILVHGDDVVASFGFTSPHPSAIVGVNSSFNICVEPRWHRKGLGTLAYAVMVRRAAELGVDFMHGSTSNPGVIRIAAQLGRKLDNWLLRRDAPFIDDELAMMPALLGEALE